MDRRGSLLWIVFLLAAMFLGPTVMLRRMEAPHNSTATLRPGEHSALRVLIEQEKLIDAPSSIPEEELGKLPQDSTGRVSIQN
jgi:hypothetical protein